MATFAELKIPFPLFEAPVKEASDYAGAATCRLCGRPDQHCFEIGDALILPCPACGALSGVNACDRIDAPCRSCASPVPFPESLKNKKQLLVCYDCLRAGKAALTKSTEFGMVAWESAFLGITHGVPGLQTDQFEMVRMDSDPDSDWYAVRVPEEYLWELLRTPSFHSWQDPCWLFCCRQPMAYVGGWSHAVESLRPADPQAFLESLFSADDEARRLSWEYFESGNASLYVYRCRACHRFRATWDSD